MMENEKQMPALIQQLWVNDCVNILHIQYTILRGTPTVYMCTCTEWSFSESLLGLFKWRSQLAWKSMLLCMQHKTLNI